jgi:GNAT superfamily N-acetyltransferase
MTSGRFGDPEPLDAGHTLEGFDCGVGSLNIWLIEHARQAAAAGSARTFVMVDSKQERVCGYYALAAAAVAHEQATERARKGQPRHPIPAVLLARLAVDASVQGRGVGAWLLQDAMRRALSASDAVGMRVLLVHALDDNARDFYERWGFEPSPTDPLNLQMLFKDIRKSLE